MVAIAAACVAGVALTELLRGPVGSGGQSSARLLLAAAGGFCVMLALLAGGVAVLAARRADSAAREAVRRERRFRDVAEMTADWVWETDAEFRLQYLTDRVEEVTGRPKGVLLGRPPWETDAEPVAGGWSGSIAAMRRHERLEGLEFAITDAAGRGRVLRIRGKPVFSEEGAFLGYRGLGTDVTAEVSARNEADRKQELLETTLENLGQGVSVVDAELRVVMFNRRFLELLDFPADLFAPGDPFEKFIRYNCERGEYGPGEGHGPGDVDAMLRERVEAARAFAPHEIERSRPDGTVLRIRGHPLPSGGFVTTYQDVTAERRTQAALEASERRTRAILDQALDAVVTIDARERIIEYNAAAERIFGWPRDEVLGRRMGDLLIPARHRERHRAGMQRFLGSGETRILGRRLELSAIRAGGEEFPIELSVTVNTAGDSPIFTAFIRDIGPRLEAEAARKAAEERLWAFLDGSPEPVSLKDRHGRYVLCNSAFERMTGVTRDRLPGMTDDAVFPGQPTLQETIRRHEELVIRGRRPVRQQREWAGGGDGRRRSFLVVKFPVFGAEGELTGVGTINQEITELKNAETQLRQAQKMQALGQLTGGVAHDFNNLLAVVLGNLELLEERLEEQPAAGQAPRDLAGAAIAAARRGAALTQRLLAFARQQPLTPQAVDLGRLLAGMADLLRQSLGDGIGLEVRCPDDLRPCYADPAQLETALLNLVINARDAMPEGGVVVIEAADGELKETGSGAGPKCGGGEGAEAPAETLAEAPVDGSDDGPPEGPLEEPLEKPLEGPCVTISVTDTGTGMAPATLERAFEPFFTTKPVGKGSGLGLSMVYGFLRQSGGQARIFSAPDRGTRVELTLPVPEEAGGTPAGSVRAPAPLMRREES